MRACVLRVVNSGVNRDAFRRISRRVLNSVVEESSSGLATKRYNVHRDKKKIAAET